MAVSVSGDYWKIINKYNDLIGKKADFPIRKSENQKRRSATFLGLRAIAGLFVQAKNANHAQRICDCTSRTPR
jgi:hypothetical protein